MTVLICGATGRTASFVIDALLKAKHDHLRLLVHKPGSIETLKKKYTSEKIEYADGDFLDEKSMVTAMKGIDIVFYNSPPIHPLETAMGISVVRAAQEAQVKHFIYASVLHPIRSKLLNHKSKAP